MKGLPLTNQHLFRSLRYVEMSSSAVSVKLPYFSHSLSLNKCVLMNGDTSSVEENCVKVGLILPKDIIWKELIITAV